MIKQLTISTIILTICLISWGQTSYENKKQVMQASEIQIDTSIIAILPVKTNLHWFFENGNPTDLTTDDILKIETILNKCIYKYNLKQERHFKKISDKHPEYELKKKNFIIDLTRYKRQYFAIINLKGEKEVWINCFCYTWNSDWKKDVIEVIDGGNCYFNLKMNLITGHYYDLRINGDA